MKRIPLLLISFAICLVSVASVLAQGVPTPQERRTAFQNAIANHLPPRLQSMLQRFSSWPDARGYDTLVYEPSPGPGHVLLCCGEPQGGWGDQTLPGNGGVWRFDAGPDRWSVVSPSNPVFADGAVYDTRRGRLIAYVDFRYNPESQNLIPVDLVNETWAFDPVTGVWKNRYPSQTPPPGLLAGGAQLAYNARWDKIVMFGGLDLAVYEKYFESCGPDFNTCDDSLLPLLETNHTWVYDYAANTWTDMAPALSPPARNSHALVYDAAADRVILFGGGDAFVDYDDTWAYDYHHNTWTQLQPAVRPAPRAYGFTAYNWAQDRIVLFGGVDYTETQIYGDTWMFNYWDQTWSLRNPTVSPSPRGWFGMTYSDRANEVVIFGGGTDRDHFTDETWLYRLGSDRWIQLPKP